MRKKVPVSLFEFFSAIPDPRIERNKQHKLVDIFVIAICGLICSADDWVSIEEFGNAKLEWFKKYLELPNGIPSHDTFGRVFSLVDPKQFEKCFISWVESVTGKMSGVVVAIDGKTSRRSGGKTRNPLHLVSAYATELGVVLGQVKTDEKSNEITAIPRLLDQLALEGCVVTIDAMGCQKEIARKIAVDKKSDYALSLKGNHGDLHDDVKLFFDDALACDFKGISHRHFESVEKGHGRIETRRYWTVDEIEWLNGKDEWKGLRTIGMVEARREIDGKESVERRWYLSSLANNAEKFARVVRSHWGIENGLHWSLDIAFREDESRIRIGNAAENFAVLRHIVMNLLKQDKTAKIGIKNKRLKAGWDEPYLVRILGLISRF